MFVASETYGEVIKTRTFEDFCTEQDIRLWVCNKADPESKGPYRKLCRVREEKLLQWRGRSPVSMMYGVPCPDGWNARTSGSTVLPYGSQKQSTTALKGQPCGLFFHPCMKHLRIHSALMKSRQYLTSCINHAGIRFHVIMLSKRYSSKLSVGRSTFMMTS